MMAMSHVRIYICMYMYMYKHTPYLRTRTIWKVASSDYKHVLLYNYVRTTLRSTGLQTISKRDMDTSTK